MKINKTSMMFEELTYSERDALLGICENIVLKGEIPYPNPYFDFWCNELGLGDRSLLLLSTAFPQRALLSVIQFDKTKMNFF